MEERLKQAREQVGILLIVLDLEKKRKMKTVFIVVKFAITS